MGSDQPPDPRRWSALLQDLQVREVAPASPSHFPDAATATSDALAGAGLVDFVDAAASAGQPVTVVANDHHRFTDTRTFLDATFGLLERHGGALPPLRLLVAGGSHAASAAERQAHEAAMLGPHASRFNEVRWHDARDASWIVPVGNTGMGAWMAEAGFYLACGSMEPHYFAGVTGAHKTLTVGVMSMESLTANHEHALSPAARPLRLDGNPVHLGIVDALADLEDSGARLLVVNQVLVDGRTAGVFAGHPLEALELGLPLVRSCFSVEVQEEADLVVAGMCPPLDRDFYQAEKGIKNTEFAVRAGGVLLLEAECAHGVGIDHFVNLLAAAPTAAEARALVEQRGYRLGDHKAVRLRALTEERGVRVGLVSRNVPSSLAPVLGVAMFGDRESAVAWARELLASPGGSPPRAIVVHDAGNVALETA